MRHGTISIGKYVYGINHEIINGYTTLETLSAMKIYNMHHGSNLQGWNAFKIDADPLIEVVIMGPIKQDRNKLLNDFKSLGWVFVRDFIDESSRTSVSILTRSHDLDIK